MENEEGVKRRRLKRKTFKRKRRLEKGGDNKEENEKE